MAAKNERVMEMVRREVKKNPNVPSQELFDKAKKMDSGMSRLSIRQFHASYPLQVKRLLKQSSTRGRRTSAAPARRGPGRPRKVGRPRKTRATTKAATTKAAKKAPVRRGPRKTAAKAAAGTTTAAARGGRDTVRSILIKFAGDVAAADQKADVVQVIGGMDRYVDQVMRAATT